MKRVVLIAMMMVLCVSCADNETRLEHQNELETESFNIERDWPGDIHHTVTLANGLIVSVDSDGTYFLDDIVFSKEQIEAMNTPQQRSVVCEPYIACWPNKVIKYNVRPGFSNSEIGYITSALNTLENTICIDFTPGGISSDYCIFFHPNSQKNSSPIGMSSKTCNTIELCVNGFNTATVIHEVMHSLGFFHEQSRNDRDNYVVIYEENIQDDKGHNFEKIADQGYTGMNIGPFDFNSIMIYSSNDFSTNGNPTMTKLDGSLISQGTSLSNYDIRGLNFIYGPKPILTTTEVYSDNHNDFNSIDETATYTNTVTFEDMTGQPVALTYPKLLVVDYHKTTQVGALDTNRDVLTTTLYYEVPAGATQYELPNTEYIKQEDLGINRYYKDEYYSVRIY